MQTSQQSLVDNFDAFIRQFVLQNIDFQMGVTTTDAYRNQYFTGSNDGSLLKSFSAYGTSTSAILGRQTANLQDNFMKIILQGDKGSSDERAFQSMKVVLRNPLNGALLRKDAQLAIIVISDEDDLSHDQDYWIENHSLDYLADPNIHNVQDYAAFLKELKGGLEKVSVHAIAIEDEACRQSLGGKKRKFGKRYFDLVGMTAGTKIDLCSNFSESLKFNSNSIVSKTAVFHLNKSPKSPETIEVKMRGEKVPKSNVEGWIYFAETRTLQFYGKWIPLQNEEVIVSYELVM